VRDLASSHGYVVLQALQEWRREKDSTRTNFIGTNLTVGGSISHMRKFLFTTLVLVASAHWTVDASGISKHGMANGGYRGSSREWTFKVTPSTTYTANGAKGSFSSIQKGVHVNVKHTGLVATHEDVVP
jgi:hypothetical protein